jgi:hypothetical protein
LLRRFLTQRGINYWSPNGFALFDDLLARRRAVQPRIKMPSAWPSSSPSLHIWPNNARNHQAAGVFRGAQIQRPSNWNEWAHLHSELQISIKKCTYTNATALLWIKGRRRLGEHQVIASNGGQGPTGRDRRDVRGYQSSKSSLHAAQHMRKRQLIFFLIIRPPIMRTVTPSFSKRCEMGFVSPFSSATSSRLKSPTRCSASNWATRNWIIRTQDTGYPSGFGTSLGCSKFSFRSSERPTLGSFYIHTGSGKRLLPRCFALKKL